MTNPKEITREEMVEAMADPKEMAERLTALAALLADGEFGDNEASAMLVEAAATLIERLTVEGLAEAVSGLKNKTGWIVNFADRQSVAQAILDHLTTGTEVQG